MEQGETRFVCSTGDKKVYLTIASAASVIQPVIDAEADNFSAEQIEVGIFLCLPAHRFPSIGTSLIAPAVCRLLSRMYLVDCFAAFGW